MSDTAREVRDIALRIEAGEWHVKNARARVLYLGRAGKDAAAAQDVLDVMRKKLNDLYAREALLRENARKSLTVRLHAQA